MKKLPIENYLNTFWTLSKDMRKKFEQKSGAYPSFFVGGLVEESKVEVVVCLTNSIKKLHKTWATRVYYKITIPWEEFAGLASFAGTNILPVHIFNERKKNYKTMFGPFVRMGEDEQATFWTELVKNKMADSVMRRDNPHLTIPSYQTREKWTRDELKKIMMGKVVNAEQRIHFTDSLTWRYTTKNAYLQNAPKSHNELTKVDLEVLKKKIQEGFGNTPHLTATSSKS